MKDYSKPYTTPYYDELKKKGIRLPCFLTHIRTDLCRMVKPKDAKMFRMLFLTPRTDDCCGTIDTRPMSNLLMMNSELSKNRIMELTYHPKPTKADLIDYFGQRIRIRKMTPREAFRLMDVADSDIDKIMNATETVTLKDGSVKTRKAISKSSCYRLAGNSIVVACLYHIFRTMFVHIRPEEEKTAQKQQLTLFS